MLVKFLRGSDIPEQFETLCSNSPKSIKIAVAYLSEKGCAAIREYLEPTFKNGVDVRFLVGLSAQHITEPQAVECLLKFREKVLKNNQRCKFKIRYYNNPGFHPKLFIFNRKVEKFVIIGSSNLTAGGLNNNIEANLMLSSSEASFGPIKEAEDYFNLIWKRDKLFGPLDLTQSVSEQYGLEVQSRKPSTYSSVIPKTKFRSPKRTDPSGTNKGKFSLILDGLKTDGYTLKAFCTECGKLVLISNKWINYWICERHCGRNTAEVPSPTEKGEKGGRIRVLIDNAEANPKLIEEKCSKKNCGKLIDLTNDFYWLVCKSCYDKLSSNQRCRVPNSDDGFLYRLSRNEIWKRK